MTTNNQVAHLWVAFNRATSDKRSACSSNGNFWFDGASIFSYRTELARFINAPTGVRYVIRNTRSYSITTSGKHQPAINRALDYGRMVREIRFDGGTQCFTSDPRSLAVALCAEAESNRDTAAKITRGKYAESRKAWLYEQAEKAIDNASFLAEAHGFPFEGAGELLAQIRREVEGAEAWQGFVRAINEVASIPTAIYDNALQSLGDIAAGVAWLAGARFAREDRVITYGRGQYHYRANRYRHERPYELPTLLRVNGDTVETSQGAEFPLAHGLAALAFQKLSGPHDFGGLGPRLGHFRIDRVEADGTVVAGCHRVPMFAVRYVASTTGRFYGGEFPHVDAAISAYLAARAEEALQDHGGIIAR